MVKILFETIAAFIGTIAFAILYRVPKTQYIVCGLVGAAGWFIYDVAKIPWSPVAATFLATLGIVLVARVLAIYRKVPVNVIMTPGIFPVVPGIAIYNTIYNMMIGDAQIGLNQGLEVLKLIGGIVLGMLVMFAIPNRVFRKIFGPRQ